ncbi:MAG: hypothetical protein R6W75_09195, partial [Smithellaceae bacterium]
MLMGLVYQQMYNSLSVYLRDVHSIEPQGYGFLLTSSAITVILFQFYILYPATGKKEYENNAREIFTYVLRDMKDEQGGFYCAEDADSEGVEGMFYLWWEEDVRNVLSKDEADLFLSHYRHADDASVHGMREIPAGSFIPHLKPFTGEEDDLQATLTKMAAIREKLFLCRKERVHPHKDDKILTDWNALMIAALARGAQVFDEPAYAQAAVDAMDFIFRSLQTEEGRLLHRYRGGEAAIHGQVDDYAFTIWALLELYEATFNTRYLFKALTYQSQLSAYFKDEKDGGFFFTARDAEKLLMRPKELYDGAIPSGNSVSFLNTLRLSRITGDVEMDESAHEIYRAFCAKADAAPTAFTQFLAGFDFAIGPSSEVIIAGGTDEEDIRKLLQALRKNFVPNKVILFRPASSSQTGIETIAPYVQPYSSIHEKATAYVCTNFTCALPTNDPDQMIALLTEKKAEG